MKDLDQNRISEVIASITETAHKLSAWELRFLESVSDQYDYSGKLSPKQLDILTKIWLKVS